MCKNKIFTKVIEPLVLISFILSFESALAGQKHFLWKVESGKNTVFLLGSVHAATEAIYPLPEVIEQAFDKSQVLVVEADINSAKPEEIMQRGMFQDSSTLKSSLSDSAYGILKACMDSLKIPIIMFDKMKPWFVGMTVSALQMLSEGFNANLGIEKHFLDKSSSKQIMELESVEDQINLLDTINNKNELVFFLINNKEPGMESPDSLLLQWSIGNTDFFEDITYSVADSSSFSKEMTDIFITKRNLGMAVKIEEYLKDDRTFFVIAGAGHLVGKFGIISLLEKTGRYKIEQM